MAIAICEFEDECTFDIRYRSFELPAGIKKIFISNEDPGADLSNLYPKDESGAILRRLSIINITTPTWKPVQQAVPATPATQPIGAAAHLTQQTHLTQPIQPHVPTPIAAWNAAHTPVLAAAGSPSA